MASVAFVRREDVDLPKVAAANAAPNSLEKIELATAGTTESQTAATTALKVIATYIPTEVLTLYVAVVAAIRVPNAENFPALWKTFYCFLVATPIILWLVYAAKCVAAQKPVPISPRAWPLWEMFAATLGYAAWAFALPQNPFQQESWYSSALAGVIVMIVSTLLGLLAPLFSRPLHS
jgi:hypothetical protein